MAEDHVSAQEFGRMQGNVESLQGFTESIDKEQKELAKTVVRNHETSMRRMDEDRKEFLAAIKQNGQHQPPCPQLQVLQAKGWGIWKTLGTIGVIILFLIAVLSFLVGG